MYKEIISENIKRLRRSSGLSQDQAAFNLFMSRTTYVRYENGERIPPVETLIKMADLFESNLYELLSVAEPIDEYPINNANQSVLSTGQISQTQYLLAFKKLSQNEKSYIFNLMNVIINAHR